ncbi:hypothetical protein EVAR_58538_1 [Eumeta japonica]|uniref:Histone-lysine N-methyltransferase SETMAR n=1 Tax=Eumeta variegata TaxID=151549 RepID=A0A4C1Z599_EUMVA|nr:hypothetical protein EVAR_58538_1 [Eumeta japonica]
MTTLAVTSAETTRFLEGQMIELTGHPPYSPDLAPNDFYLFPNELTRRAPDPYPMSAWVAFFRPPEAKFRKGRDYFFGYIGRK